ncbi:hypothetical protein [Streptomyces sp. NBC_00503]|uniref:hypothetical protein n=1 Tax=Streptomyces sp. NBC_00503 TaxID=2903659 RepID=UPI002E8248BE|nr:hypothetical protein [Streptomyces sp. NBC_00503]WUD85166.1 hypothetical protein OG490_33960 [Streptomyces sp. NBC_00503]
MRRGTVWGGILGAVGVVPIALDGTEHMPWWLNLTLCLTFGLMGGVGGAVTAHRSGTKDEVRRATLDAGEMELNEYRVKLVPDGATPPPPLKEKDYTSYSLTTTTRRLQLWEFGYLPQWSHPWRELRLTAEGHVLVITGPQGLLGRFVLAEMLVPEELVLASNRLRARTPGGSSSA